MTRKTGMLLLALVVAGGTSATARGDVAAASGQLLDFVNYRSEPQWQASFVNAAMCNGAAALQLEWNLGVTPARSGVYILYASNAAPRANGTDPTVFCPTYDDANTWIRAGPIAGGIGTQVTAVQRITSVNGAAAVAPAGLTCSGANENRILYICAHYTEGATPTASAVGKFVIQTQAPGAPTIASVLPAASAFDVSWTAPTSGAPVDHYVIVATPLDGGDSRTPVASAVILGTSGRITGVLGAPAYEVTVVAYSIGGNPSAPSPAVVATPDPPNGVVEPVDPAPPVIRSHGGGCGTGGAGPEALLALVALARLRRQRR